MLVGTRAAGAGLPGGADAVGAAGAVGAIGVTVACAAARAAGGVGSARPPPGAAPAPLPAVVPAAGASGRKASMRSSVISKPSRGSGASDRSRRDLVVELHVLGAHRAAHSGERLGIEFLVLLRGIGHDLHDRDALQKGRQIGERAVVVRGIAVQLGHLREQSGAVLTRQRLDDAGHVSAVDGAEHGARVRLA
jgi:hypothetical protein